MQAADMQAAAAAASASSAALGVSVSGLSLQWLGVPLPVLLLGLSGAMSALSFLPPMRVSQMVVAVIVGTLAAAATTPIAAHFFSLPTPLHLGVAYIAGLFAQLMLTWAFIRLPAIVEKRLGGDQ